MRKCVTEDKKLLQIFGIANVQVEQKEQIIIAVSEEIFQYQMIQFTVTYYNSSKVSESLIENLTCEMAQDKVLLFDEVDYMIDNQTFFFKSVSKELNSKVMIVAYYSKKSYLVSETIKILNEQLLLHILTYKISHLSSD